MVSGQVEASFRMVAFVQNGKVEFAIQHNNGTAYYSEKDLDAMVHHIRAAAKKEKAND